MEHKPTWQARAVEQLSQLFDKEPDAKAFVLTGSLASQEAQEDVWSDVDAKIVLADHVLDRYYLSTDWLFPFGRVIGVERHDHERTKTLRLCLEGFQRFDLTFIAASALQHPSLWDDNPFYPAHVVVLIASHLSLDLARDSLALQMIRRDQEKRTRIHRIGGWGNEVVTRFSWDSKEGASQGILSLIRSSCENFDELASNLLPGYDRRGPLLFPSIESAKQTCSRRSRSEQ